MRDACGVHEEMTSKTAVFHDATGSPRGLWVERLTVFMLLRFFLNVGCLLS